jgi:hypothetical protein
MNARKKGLNYVREVRKILEAMNHQVEGPGYGVAFFAGRMLPIHRDYWGIFDLISFNGEFHGHQVSTLSNKAVKVKAIRDKMFPGWVWCRVNKANRVGYRVFQIDSFGIVEDNEMQFIPKAILGSGKGDK